jgi:hypothetical protein
MQGHWYCSFCNDVVNLRKPYGRWDLKRGEQCPVCRHHSADWIPDRPQNLSGDRAKILFHQMKEQVK